MMDNDSKNTDKIFTHYKLSFKKETIIPPPSDNTDNIGSLIIGTLNDLKLYGAIYFTNLMFLSSATAKEYLSLTYNPKFMYIPKLNTKTQPHHIQDKNILITQRVSPAFGKHGGAGEWILTSKDLGENINKIELEVEKYYPDGGDAERWYIGAWKREVIYDVIASLISSYTGKHVTSGYLSDVWKKKEINITEIDNIEGIEESFWEKGDIPSILKVTPSGIVAYTPLYEKKVSEKIKIIAYLSISCGFQIIYDYVYLKFWGNIWEDFLFFDKECCDKEIKLTSTIYKDTEVEKCIWWKYLQSKVSPILDRKTQCGIRLSSLIIETTEKIYKKEDFEKQNQDMIKKEINSIVVGLKKFLKNIYKDWCPFYPKKLILLQKIILLPKLCQCDKSKIDECAG